MKNITKSLLVICFWLLPALAWAELPGEWKQVTHGGLSFSIPVDWGVIKERELEGQWGVQDKEKRQGIAFALSRERRPERMLKGAEKDGMEVKALGAVSLGALTGQRHQISGQMKGAELFVSVVILDGLLPDGDRITFSASLIDMPIDEWRPVIEQVMASVVPTPELEALLQGYSRHELFEGLISLEVRNNWEKTDHKDNVSWEPPLVSLYGAHMIRFAHGYHLTGSNGLLSKLKDPVIEKSEMYGIPAWKIAGTGLGITYTSPMRKQAVPATTVLYLSDICLAEGDRFGYAITATDTQLAEHKVELDKLLASVRLNLPEQAGPCDDLVAYHWNDGLEVRVPRSWRKNQDSRYQLSWYDRVLATGANIKVFINHNTTDVHPITGYEHPAETLEQLTIDGYPATHFRKKQTDSSKVEAIHDYYIIDTRMRFKADGQRHAPSFFIVHFTTSPATVAEPDVALHKRLLDSIVFGPQWESETPVERVERSPSVARPADDQPAPTTGVAAGDQPVAADVDPVDVPVQVDERVQAEHEIPPSVTADRVTDAASAPVAAEPGVTAVVDPARQRYEQASALRSEGAALQQQGKLAEAIRKYRSSLALYPDDRLEAHVRLIESALNGAEQ